MQSPSAAGAFEAQFTQRSESYFIYKLLIFLYFRLKVETASKHNLIYKRPELFSNRTLKSINESEAGDENEDILTDEDLDDSDV